AGEPEKDKGKDKKEKKQSKKDKKKKKKQTSSSSDDDTSDSSESVQCDDQADALSAFGLCKKDLVRGENMLRWDDLSCRPFAYVLSCITEQLTAGDVFELGGELEPLHAFVRRLPCFVHSPSC
ncbi:unnamed protein product, partial [Symbiodinium sp. CCMP2592]